MQQRRGKSFSEPESSLREVALIAAAIYAAQESRVTPAAAPAGAARGVDAPGQGRKPARVTIEIELDGARRQVTLRREGDRWIAGIDGREVAVSVAETGGQWSMLVVRPRFFRLTASWLQLRQSPSSLSPRAS